MRAGDRAGARLPAGVLELAACDGSRVPPEQLWAQDLRSLSQAEQQFLLQAMLARSSAGQLTPLSVHQVGGAPGRLALGGRPAQAGAAAAA
jgi:hypothetical protein